MTAAGDTTNRIRADYARIIMFSPRAMHDAYVVDACFRKKNVDLEVYLFPSTKTTSIPATTHFVCDAHQRFKWRPKQEGKKR